MLGTCTAEHAEILTVEAQRFVATLHRCFNGRRKELLHRRVMRQYEIDAGQLPGKTARANQINIDQFYCISESAGTRHGLEYTCITADDCLSTWHSVGGSLIASSRCASIIKSNLHIYVADFLPQTANIRDDPTWQGAPPAPGLVDRRVEITGPVDRKMVINALNSGASCFMADFEGEPAAQQ